jgi:hypothetical protein
MKKVSFAAFAGLCIFSSVMSSSANSGKINTKPEINQMAGDTMPNKKADTSSYPKRDTASMPRLDRNQQ